MALISNAHAAEWRIAPAARVGSTYTDNPRLVESNPTSSAGVIGELSANLQRRTELLELALRPMLRSSRYRDDETLDADDRYLEASAAYQRERSQWTASVNLVRDTTLTSELGSTGFVGSNRPHEQISVTASPVFYVTERLSAGAQFYWQDNRYIDAQFTGLVDYDYRTAALFSVFAVSDRSDLTVTAQGGRLRVADFDTRTDDAQLKLSWSHDLDSLWTTELWVGPAYVDTEQRSDDGFVYGALAERVAERWRFSMRAARDLAPTGRGVLTRRDRITMSASRRLTEYFTGSASLQWVRNEDLAIDQDEATYLVNYGRFELAGYWRFAEHWALSLAAAAAAQESGRDAYRAHNYQASLSLLWNGQPRSL